MNEERRTGKDWRLITDRDGDSFLRERIYYENEPDKCFDFYTIFAKELSRKKSHMITKFYDIARETGISEEEVIQKLLNGEIIDQP
jgi:hypothetical protein